MGFKISKNAQIHPTAVINVIEGEIGEGVIINEGARIEGRRVVIGREAFIDRGAVIGGGSCFDPQAELVAGDWLHMGLNSQINIARGVSIGHEFGCGIETKIFTHGAYIDSYRLGAPVQWGRVEIGDSVWMPNAWVNPGLKIGSNVIISARSLVNSNIESNCLAGGVPCKVLKAHYFPREVNKAALIQEIIDQTLLRAKVEKQMSFSPYVQWNPLGEEICIDSEKMQTIFNLKERKIFGDEKDFSFLLKDQLRRNGIRFRFSWNESNWQSW